CASAAPGGALTACIDEIFALDGTCRQIPDSTFSHFTALPPPNRYDQICVTPSPPCTGNASEVRFTTDAAGNMLVPMDWQGVLVRSANVPVPRLLRGGSSIEGFAGSGLPIEIPAQAFITSHTPEGAVLPPIFVPQVDAESSNEVSLFGSADAPHTVLR